MTPCVKVAHPTRDAALEHVKQLVWKNHVAGEAHRSRGLAPYPCDHCGAWHVGHSETVPLAWHYTVRVYLDKILEADALTPASPRVTGRKALRHLSPGERRFTKALDEPAPLLWCSRNPDWEHSVLKTMEPWGRARNEICCGGLLRFGVPSSFLKLRWSDYLALNHTPKVVAKAMSSLGNPAEWLATDSAVPLDDVRKIQVYYRGAWTDVADVTDEDFAVYLAGRRAAYDAAFRSLGEKIAAAEAAGLTGRVTLDATDTERILYEDLVLHTDLLAKGSTNKLRHK